MTIANDGDRVSGTLAPEPGDSPVAYTQVTDQDGHTIKGGDNDSTHEQVVDQGTAEEAKSILETVVTSGTGVHANIGAAGQWGKTGTTENNGDAWFCGGALEVTACVWVGYADSTTPMTTLYNGGPVMGGTFPALIWASVISAWERHQSRNRRRKGERVRPAKAAPPKAKKKRNLRPAERRSPGRNRRSGARSRRSARTRARKKKQRRRPKKQRPKKRRRRPNRRGGTGGGISAG